MQWKSEQIFYNVYAYMYEYMYVYIHASIYVSIYIHYWHNRSGIFFNLINNITN